VNPRSPHAVAGAILHAVAGPLGFAGAIAALRLVMCPHCGRKQMRARGVRGPINCKFCRKAFEPPPPPPERPKRRRR
jgi:hypothetical protein